MLQLTSDQIFSLGMHENPREVTFIELTACFETTFEAAIQKKSLKSIKN